MYDENMCYNNHGLCDDERCYCFECERGECDICLEAEVGEEKEVTEEEYVYNYGEPESTYCPPMSFEQRWL